MTKNSNVNSIPLSINDFKVASNLENVLIIDTRLPDYYELGHVFSSINICHNQAYGNNLGSVFYMHNPILIVSKESEIQQSYSNLISIGFTKILGHLNGGIEAWIAENQKFDMVISISSEELALDAKHNPSAIILDVRSKAEYNALHVANAVNLTLEEIAKEIPKLNKFQETLIYSNSGYSSMLVSGLLKHFGFTNIKNVWGGFERIKEETVELISTKS
ncbi:MAG: hypothetical protein KA981_00645 [Bacteroidia bacterium]|nr:hypothetical protein [Bacteroidia bacterium]